MPRDDHDRFAPMPHYPLAIGDTLHSAECIDLNVNALLGDGQLACLKRCPNAGFFGVILLLESMRQDPAGTLPEDDEELAVLAGLGLDLGRWRALREDALRGWHRCLVRDPMGSPRVRLMHARATRMALRAFEPMSSSCRERATIDTNTRRFRR